MIDEDVYTIYQFTGQDVDVINTRTLTTKRISRDAIKEYKLVQSHVELFMKDFGDLIIGQFNGILYVWFRDKLYKSRDKGSLRYAYLSENRNMLTISFIDSSCEIGMSAISDTCRVHEDSFRIYCCMVDCGECTRNQYKKRVLFGD